jgi:putative transposase
MLDVTRQLYNALLQERRDAYRFNKVRLTTRTQYHELTELRAEDLRVKAVYRECEDAVLHRLDLAMAGFFRRVTRGETAGFPRFKNKERWEHLEFPHGGRALRMDARQDRVTVPGVGAVKLRKGRVVPVGWGRAWVRHKVGLGADRGVHVLVALSDGQLIANAAVGERRKSATARLQRELEAATLRDSAGCVLNRRDPGRLRAQQRLARSKMREAAARRDYAHKVSRSIVAGADVIGLEKLRLRSMTRSAKGTAEQPGRNVRAKAALNRRLLDSSFGLLRQMIVAKAEEAARTVVEVDAHFSSQTCSRCDHVASESRRRRRFACVSCGYGNHADVNAALVIRRRAQLALQSEPDPAEDAGRRHQDVAA